MFRSSIAKITPSIFPIFGISNQGPHAGIAVLGTGFFIDTNGHFMTALHVIQGIPKNFNAAYLGLLPGKLEVPPHIITEAHKEVTRDIYIGRVTLSRPTNPIQFENPLPQIGESICLCGYPMAEVGISNHGQNPNIELGSVRRYWKPTHVLDFQSVTVDKVTHDALITQDESLPGMSGAPVFNLNGNVIGMDVASMHRNVQYPGGHSLDVINGIVVRNQQLLDAISAANLS